MPIPQIVCIGDAYEVGFQHGSQVAKQVNGSICFYKNMLETYTGLDWNQITPIAVQFGACMKKNWPEYFREIEGVADGAGCSLSDALALNVRTEIAFGLMNPDRVVSDGCTSLAWTGSGASRMGQNWDWMEEQKENIIFLEIRKTGKPTIKMMTEGGIIGKIGMNSEGLGVCLNAVRCRGIDIERLPIHLTLRMALDSGTVHEAVQRLESTGTGGSGFLLLGQGNETVGLEFTSKSVIQLKADAVGRVMHTNHLLSGNHGEVEEWPEEDSLDRLRRLRELTEQLADKDGFFKEEEFSKIFDDHQGHPMSICRWQEGECLDATLFNITMNLLDRSGRIVIGKPCELEEILAFNFMVDTTKARPSR